MSFRVKVTYTTGVEFYDVESISNASAIIEALRLSNLKDRRLSLYRKVVKVEIVEK